MLTSSVIARRPNDCQQRTLTVMLLAIAQQLAGLAIISTYSTCEYTFILALSMCQLLTIQTSFLLLG